MLAAVSPHGMALVAYSPPAQGNVFEHETLKSIAETHGKTAAQVALHWLVQQEGVIAIPRSSDERYAMENLMIFDITLSPSKMAEISIHKIRRL